jgi:hypothetical protein
MNEKGVFTSTGEKLLHHPAIVSRLQHNYGAPVSIQIAPTSRCQLNCIFCSNTNRSKHEDLSFKKVSKFLYDMFYLGAKTVEWTGGGDPSMYGEINASVALAHELKMQQGLITNGLGFANFERQRLKTFDWIRISMNCLDYVDSINIPSLAIKTTLGFSYVLNDKTSEKILTKLRAYVKKYSPKYVRIVPNCQVTKEEQEENNAYYSKLVASWGGPYFYQAKAFEKPELCYWGHLKPFILHDEYVYRCSSVVLNSNAERSFHETYRWCHMSELVAIYKKKMIPYVPEGCDKCVFTQQNNLVHEILNPNSMTNFL